MNRKILIGLAFAILLQGCGGGSSTPPQSQQLVLRESGPISLVIDETYTNPATANGSNTIIYTSSNPEVAKVDQAGKVTALSSGQIQITASIAADKNYTGSTIGYTLNVSKKSQSLSFNQKDTVSIKVTDVLKNPATGSGSGQITYASSAPDVALVNESGEIEVNKAGQATISATIAADNKYEAATATYDLNVSALEQNLFFLGVPPLKAIAGDSFSYNATGLGTGEIKYLSSDTSIATVDSSGTVHLVGSGSVIISATIASDGWYLADSVSSTIKVDRAPQAITFINGDLVTKNFGDAQFVNPAIAQGKGAITYRSSDPEVATVDANGIVKVIGGGTADIYANIEQDNQYEQAETSYQLLVNAIPQTLSFGQAGPLKVRTGDQIINKASAPGSGAINYSSSNPDIASVTNGEVVINSPGKATITAEIDADRNYLNASASYEIKSGFPLKAWIGKNDTLVDLPADITSFEFFRSSDVNCDYRNYLACTNGQFSPANTNSVVDTTTTLSHTGFYLFKNYDIEINHTMKADITDDTSSVYADFKARRGHQVVTFLNKMWVIGGEADNGNTLKNDVWSSTDGLSWTLEQASAKFSPRAYHKVVVFNNKLWLIGGVQYSQKLNDVWSSSDGVNWNLETASASFSGRHNAAAVTFNNKLWLVGGYDDGYKNDVWSSTDGINWTQEVNQANFPGRNGHSLIAFNNKLYLIGGAANNYYDDVWSSPDGLSWSQEIAHAGFSARSTAVTAFNNQLWVVGGASANGRTNDVWSSNDGTTWTQKTSAAEFTARSSHQLINLGNRLFVIAGDDANSATNRDFVGDVWSSTDGTNWRIGYLGTVTP